jgi:hypothetical protein
MSQPASQREPRAFEFEPTSAFTNEHDRELMLKDFARLLAGITSDHERIFKYRFG